MNCDKARRILLERLDEGSTGPVQADVEQHLADCASCAREAERFRAEEKVLARYREARLEGLEPPPGAWERIVAATGSRSRGFGSWAGVMAWIERPWLRQLAFAAALVVASVGVTLLAVRHFEPSRAPAVADRGGGSGTLEEALQAIDLAERQYQEAIRVLSKTVEKRKSALDPGLVAELERNLRVVDAGIEAARRAYREHGSDTELAYYMLAAYRKKMEILQEIALS